MKVSLNQIKQYIDFELPPTEELVQRINSQLGGVEEVIDLNDKYKDAKIVRVVECEKHPNADRLNVTKIDAGTGELIQVVCGAPNVHADMWAVWLPPDSIVPATYDDAEPFRLGARKLRGVMSQGMLAAADELAIGSDHEGIVEVTANDLRESNSELLIPGASFAEVFGLDDTIIDIENKMFTHRPDLFGQLGVAREIAGIYGHQFTSPSWYIDTPEFASGEGLELHVANEASDKVPRFMAVALKDVEVKPSPVWLQAALVSMGAKPINNIVDVTNYVMLLTAQPTHAYDYDKLAGHKLAARMAKNGEKAELLNGKTYELTAEDIVIADVEKVVGVGGIMGGATCEVSAETKSIVLEVATFDMYTVRKSSMRHGLFTDALTRFNKGQSPLQNDHVMNLLLMSIRDVSPAEQASDVFDVKNDKLQMKAPLGNFVYWKNGVPNMFEWGSYSTVITTDQEFVSSRLGLDLDSNVIEKLLQNVELKAHAGDHPDYPNEMEVIAPFWRTDLELEEDIVEEVGRLYGFDKLPRELPRRSASPAAHNAEIAAKQRVRETLARAGANEVLTYSFVHENILKKAGQDPSQAYQLSNALSPDLQYYRLSVLPSLLDKVHMNIKSGHDEFILYELGKAHHIAAHDSDGLPEESARVAGVYAARKAADDAGAAYYQAKRTVEYLTQLVLPGVAMRYVRLDKYDAPDAPFVGQLIVPFDPVRSAAVEIDGVFAGVVGELRPSVAREFKLPAHIAAFELFVTPYVTRVAPRYVPLSRYPSMQRDVSFRVATDVEYATVYDAAIVDDRTVRITTRLIDIYQADDAGDKTITLRFTLTPSRATLSADEASAIEQQLVASVVAATGAQVV